jgi:hypothetical protein
MNIGDDMFTTYNISQLCVIAAVIFLGLTYLLKNKKTILFLAILISLLYGAQYILLSAFTGFAINMVSIIRNVWFYINAKKEKKNEFWVLLALILIASTFSLFTYKDMYSIFPLLAFILYTYSIWQSNIKVYRWLAIPISISWIIYNVYAKTLFGTITECSLLVIEIIGITKLKKNAKK